MKKRLLIPTGLIIMLLVAVTSVALASAGTAKPANLVDTVR